MHTCSHTLSVRTRVCAHDADFTVLPFLQPMSITIYVYPSAWNTRMEMCHTCRWECDSCSKAWALCRFIYCFNDAVCFIFMYFVRNDEIKTVNYMKQLHWKQNKKHQQQQQQQNTMTHIDTNNLSMLKWVIVYLNTVRSWDYIIIFTMVPSSHLFINLFSRLK